MRKREDGNERQIRELKGVKDEKKRIEGKDIGPMIITGDKFERGGGNEVKGNRVEREGV